MKLTEHEIREAHKNPDVLRAIANQHDVSEAEGGAIGPEFASATEYHRRRAIELRGAANAIEAEY